MIDSNFGRNAVKDTDIMLEVVDLKKYFNVGNSIRKSKRRILTAVDGLNFFIKRRDLRSCG